MFILLYYFCIFKMLFLVFLLTFVIESFSFCLNINMNDYTFQCMK